MKNVKVHLQPIVSNLNLPTVLKTAILPGDSIERLFIATQVGEIYFIEDETIETFLDIRDRIIKLGSNGGYDERGLLGLAFHPHFYYNGLFYLHYSVAGSQGPDAIPTTFEPDPCNPDTINLKWTDREKRYNHIDTVEEWSLQTMGPPVLRRTLLNLRRPFMNHNGVNTLNFSPESGKLILTTGDGGAGYDPFNLAQDNLEIAGKIIEIDVDKDVMVNELPAVTRFDELPASVLSTFSVIAKGVRNIPGIAFQWHGDHFEKLVGIVGQDLVESIYSFSFYTSVSSTQLLQNTAMETDTDPEGMINFGWRGWEGDLPTPVIRGCSEDQEQREIITAYYNEAIETVTKRIKPLACYYHIDPRPDKFQGTALTGVQSYMGHGIPDLTESVVFTDFVRSEGFPPPARGVLAYTRVESGCIQNDYGLIETDYDFGSNAAYYVSLGTNLDQSILFLGVYGSSNVTDLNQGMVFAIYHKT